MFNTSIGVASSEAGRSFLTTAVGHTGHAVYGPYEFREAGSYAVDFFLELADPAVRGRDPVCAVLDVVRGGGQDSLVTRKVRLSELRDGRTRFQLNFALNRRSKMEYRVWTSGVASLHVDNHRRVHRLDDAAGRTDRLAVLDHFPEPDEAQPTFFRNNVALFRAMFDRGYGLAFVGDDAILSFNGLFFHARCDDDFNFVGEVFESNVYNFVTDEPTCVIDIGMNVGFSSLQFARKDNVREVFSYEPFAATFRRAIDNLSLNPDLAAKITPACIGLSDRNWSGEIGVGASGNSGSGSVVAGGGGQSVTVTLADAAETLEPLLRSARERGLRTVVKVDCEGSEFAVFASLARAGLFALVDAVMVEWHTMFDGLNQSDLFAPLLAAGFLVFDQSPPIGNGFFYAVKLPRRQAG